MKIGKDMKVDIDYNFKLDRGKIIPGEPKGGLAHRASFIFGRGQILPALEQRLKGLEPNNQIEVTLPPEEAFGKVREDLIKEAPIEIFPPNLEVKEGQRYQTHNPVAEPTYFTVRKIKEDGTVILDFNNPLAGEKLHFDISIRSVKLASTEELSKA